MDAAYFGNPTVAARSPAQAHQIIDAALRLAAQIWAERGDLGALDAAHALRLAAQAACPECSGDDGFGDLCGEHVAARVEALTGCDGCGHFEAAMCPRCEVL